MVADVAVVGGKGGPGCCGKVAVVVAGVGKALQWVVVVAMLIGVGAVAGMLVEGSRSGLVVGWVPR